ncbi:hypothetical protein BLNAU_8864 [Blattamonas nauphoetae]|uniref:NTF2-related export protein n=1 Tax=Blattamonas nauphoetae TaxID=2049346 RepID=A0ABQ9XX76_9EUKA|nr:hypothetical protein BLNAU_8864 [Blattamonas nauphoetae]
MHNQQANQLILEKVNESCQLGSEFILQFYNLFDANREQLKSLFAPGSHYFFRGNSFPNDRCDIPSLLSTLPPSKHDLFSFDSQPIFDQNYQWIALQLTIRGTVQFEGERKKPFLETLILIPDANRGTLGVQFGTFRMIETPSS